VSAADYHTRRVEELFPIVLDAYRTLAAEHDVILLEGAGSPAEINLKAHDIVNMRMAQAAGAACFLVGDIDRGGVFASLLGTVELLEPCERELLRGFIVNKFRGDAGLLEPGIEMMEKRIGIPCGGVVPYLPDLGLDEEDSVALEDRPSPARAWAGGDDRPDRPLRIGVVAFPYMANFTDFHSLAAEPSVALAFLDRHEDAARADLLVLPGSKQTLDDLEWLRRRGFEAAIRGFGGGAGVMGICGGMQMLGLSIDDPAGAENGGVARRDRGLGLLPIRTTLEAEKVTRVVHGRVRGRPLPAFRGYEIHLGKTEYADDAEPFSEITRCGEEGWHMDGAVSSGAAGTYIHGLFHEDAFRHSFLATARAACGLAPPGELVCFAAERDARINGLAAHVRGSLNLDLIHRSLEPR
jgi:adenosylcobyric acid synthase